ncbi:hypothetical protein BpHYR1_029541 [Brachionus plicatilis]|uniref:Uncharacterized protein n=1 Tax=Brachionus plicatilis TaxID=10195 RepID=A0A3M7R8G5_BRAPC|nr:hypothetical protein BpHYR1_029541 [Brachionus plicatilis]
MVKKASSLALGFKVANFNSTLTMSWSYHTFELFSEVSLKLYKLRTRSSIRSICSISIILIVCVFENKTLSLRRIAVLTYLKNLFIIADIG